MKAANLVFSYRTHTGSNVGDKELRFGGKRSFGQSFSQYIVHSGLLEERLPILESSRLRLRLWA
jgi:hypothetical protein